MEGIEMEAEMVEHITAARVALGDKLFDEGAYADAVVAFAAALEFAPESEVARRGLEKAQRGLDIQTLRLPEHGDGSEPQVLQHLVAQVWPLRCAPRRIDTGVIASQACD